MSFLCWAPAVIAWHAFHNNFEDGVCIYLTHRYYILASAVLIYYVPMICVVVLYIRVYQAVKKSSLFLQENFASKDITNNGKNIILSESCQSNKNEEPRKKECDNFAAIDAQTPLDPSRLQDDCGGHSENVDAIAGTVTFTSTNNAEQSVEISTISRAVQKDGGEVRQKERIKPALKSRMSLHRRAAKTLGIIVVLFLICWLPFVILFPIHGFCECVPIRLYDASYWMAYINSTMNPFLYGFNKDFRKAFMRLFIKRDTASKSSTYYMSKSNATSHQSQFN